MPETKAEKKKRKQTNKLKSTPPILLAADEGDVDKVHAILEADPDAVNHVNRSGFTALHQAAHAGEEFVIEELLDFKADVNRRCKDGCTPAMYASAQGFFEIVEQLYRAGADLTVTDLDGDNAHGVARNKKTKDLIAACIAAGPYVASEAPEKEKEKEREDASAAEAVAEVTGAVAEVSLSDPPTEANAENAENAE